MFGLFAFFALLFFVAINGFALAALGTGFWLLIALRLRRRGEFWLLSSGVALLCGGAGALSAAWGAYFGTVQLSPDSLWPFSAWFLGYVFGGIGGAVWGAFGVAFWRRDELPGIEAGLKKSFQAAKSQLSTLGFRQTLRVGAYSLRVALFKSRKVI